ncbi:hypothetical protein KYJ98_09170 [Mammaliicoccus lentus]|uniref:hypothetical protein n=1 Tax=Mammaliicoccus lentus TaxID=42858 RepID=UPI001C4E2D3C|nr:hypothetical protein [Mammaliicoccus lentus]MBW0770486.1 hypothetical protein [Mammaliicoccus lentus]
MPTIKTKKEMNLPELIEWGWNNKELSKNKRFISKNKGNLAIKQSVIFNHFSYAEIENNYCYGPEDTFTVEVEEQVDENTELTALVELSSRGLLGNTRLYRYHSINEVIDNQSVAFYILNDDQTMDLIWKNGRLVE